MAGTLRVDKLRVNQIDNYQGDKTFIDQGDHMPGSIIEYLSSPCDGSTVVVGSGSYTFENVTESQVSSTTYTKIEGSSIVYTPPPGASRVVYEYDYHQGRGSAGTTRQILHYKFYIDDNEVVAARYSMDVNAANDLGEEKFRWTIAIGGTTDNNTGRQATWTNGKKLELRWREYSSSYRGALNQTYYWDGSTGSHLNMPRLTIIAIA